MLQVNVTVMNQFVKAIQMLFQSTEIDYAKIVLGWVTAWEHHMLLAFHLGHEADHSPPSSAEVKEWVELYLHPPNTPSWHGTQLGEQRDNFTFTLP
jgi:hypothetical protein